MSQIAEAEFEQANNPYRASAYEDESLAAAPADLPVDELRAFVGGKAEYYLRKWEPRLIDPTADAGMNWAAFWLPGMWIAYRKMYAIALIYTAIHLVFYVAMNVIFVVVLKMPQTPLAVFLIGGAVNSIICGLFANAWYLGHARVRHRRARAQGLEHEFLLHTLAVRGGTSIAGCIGMWFLSFFLGFVVGFVWAAFAFAYTNG